MLDILYKTAVISGSDLKIKGLKLKLLLEMSDQIEKYKSLKCIFSKIGLEEVTLLHNPTGSEHCVCCTVELVFPYNI